MKRFGALLAAFFALSFGSVGQGFAGISDPMIEGAKMCTRYLPRFERQYGIPTHLLSAIASTESGRYHKGLKINLPWPWTINAEGKGYFFDSKQEAIDAVRRLRASGMKSIDVGCMQVNLHHHPNAFASLEQAFEPEYNVAYAASFLRDLFQQTASWKEAAGDYHSKTPERGTQYVGLVYDRWYTIIDRLRSARQVVPQGSLVAINDMKNQMANDVQTASAAKIPVSVASGPKLVRVANNVTTRQPVRMNSIQVTNRESSNARQRDNGIIIVRPDITVASEPVAVPKLAAANVVVTTPVAQTITVAQNQQAMNTGNEGIIRLDGRRVVSSNTTQTARKSGPNFIFHD